MCFLKPLYARNFTYIRKPKNIVGFILSWVIFFIGSAVHAIPPFQDRLSLDLSSYLKLTATAEPTSINPKGRFLLYVKIEVSEGWHIYSLESKKYKEESLATKISLNSDSFSPQGSWKESSPTIKWDGALERVVKIHDHTVEFRRWYRVTKYLAPGPHWIKGSMVFRVCNNKIC
ncbi:uncharacterized protein METZ01_LOCUS361770, partial [marine metagenome]